MELLPYPRSLKRQAGLYTLPEHPVLFLDGRLPRETVLLPVADRLQGAAKEAGVNLELITGPAKHPRLAIQALKSDRAPDHAEGYALVINRQGVTIFYREAGGFRAA